MIENDDAARLAGVAGVLRDTFARHEGEAPDPALLRHGIQELRVRRRRRRSRVTIASVAAAVTLIAVAIPVTLRLLPQPATQLMEGVVTGSVPDRALNFLVLGLDDEPGFSPPYRSDSITIVHIDKDRQHVYLVDIERDVWVDIPGHGPNKINAAYALGGAALSTQVVANVTGVAIDGSVVVTQQALVGLVDALGPLNMCVSQQITSIHTGHVFPVGCYSLSGADVADLVRQRMTLQQGAYDRDRTIEQAMRALFRQAATGNVLTDPGRIAALLRIQGLTAELPGIDAIGLAGQLHGLGAAAMLEIVSPAFQSITVNGHPEEQLDPVVTPELFRALHDDTLATFVTAHPDWLSNNR